MALIKALRFRFLESQLTNSESHQLMSQLLDQNRDMIMTALFNQILKSANQQQCNGDEINNIISKIIKSRKKKPKPIPTQNIKLNQLPKRLIGVIASFLNQYDYGHFSQINRFIYLGCNSPNLLQELDLNVIKNYSAINLKLFPSVKYLGLTLTQCEEIIPSMNGLSHMNQLKAIEIHADRKTDVNTDTILTSDCIHNDNITHLTCCDFADENTFFPAEKFMKLLTKFPNVEYLNLLGVNANIDVNKTKDLYPSLKGLGLDCGIRHINRDLIHIFGNNLDYLAFTEYELEFDFRLQNINFSKLEELISVTPTSKSINDILKTAKNLKKVCIIVNTREYTLMTPKEMKNAISNSILSCKSLEYIQYMDKSLDNGTFLASILDGIEKGLFKTKNCKRNEIKIDIRTQSNDTFKPMDFMFNIAKIIGWLDCSQINDFMFIWELCGLNKETNKSILLQQLRSECSSLNIVIDLHGDCFVISNNDCKINGFNESWKCK